MSLVEYANSPMIFRLDLNRSAQQIKMLGSIRWIPFLYMDISIVLRWVQEESLLLQLLAKNLEWDAGIEFRAQKTVLQ